VTTVNGAAVFVPNPCPSPTQPGVVSCAGITYPSTYVSIAPVQYAQTCQSLPGQCSVDGQSDSANPCSPGSNCAPQECQGPDGQCYVVNNWTTEWDHFGQNPSGSQTQYQFLTGAITFTCFGNCRQWQPGWRDYYHVDGSKDGVAMNWGNGPSGMDYESAEVAIFDDASHPGTSTCSHPRGDSYASWYQVTGQYPVSHNGPWGAISMAQGTETLGMQYQNADSYGCDGSPSFRFAWSWGVLADMYG